MVTAPVLYVAAAAAVIVVGLSKGGFVGLSTLGLPLLALVMPPVQAAAVMLPILIVQDVVSVIAYRRFYDKRTLAILLPGAVAGIGIGAMTAAVISDAHIRLLVGFIAVVFALNWWLGLSKQAIEARPGGVVAGLFWGAVAGLTSFVSNAGGPPFQVYVLPQRLPRDVMVGTTTWFFAIVNLLKVAPYVWLGQFTHANLAISGALFPVAVLSTMAGVWLVRRVNPETFYKIIYGLLAVVGVKLIADGASALI